MVNANNNNNNNNNNTNDSAAEAAQTVAMTAVAELFSPDMADSTKNDIHRRRGCHAADETALLLSRAVVSMGV